MLPYKKLDQLQEAIQLQDPGKTEKLLAELKPLLKGTELETLPQSYDEIWTPEIDFQQQSKSTDTFESRSLERESALERPTTLKELPLHPTLERTFSEKSTQKQLVKAIRNLFWWGFVPLTAAMLWVVSHFGFDQYVDHIQDWYKPLNQWTGFFFHSPEVAPYFHPYFLLDLVWALVLALLLYRIHLWFVSNERIKSDDRKDPALSPIFSGGSSKFLLVLLGVAVGLDWLEYLFNALAFEGIESEQMAFSILGYLVPAKYITYGLALLIIAVQALQYLFTRKHTLSEIRSYLQQNVVSLIVILLLLFIMTKMGQGGALVESLLEKPVAYITPFIFLVNVLVLMTWQWPYYHNLFRSIRKPSRSTEPPGGQRPLAASKAEASFWAIHPFQPLFSKRSSLQTTAGITEADEPNEPNRPSGAIDLLDITSLGQAFFYLVFLKKPEKKIKQAPEEGNVTWYDLQRLQAILGFLVAVYVLLFHWGKSISAPVLGYVSIMGILGIIWIYFRIKSQYPKSSEGSSGERTAFWKKFRWIVSLCLLGMVLCYSALTVANIFQWGSQVRLALLATFFLLNALLFVPIVISRSGFTKRNSELANGKLRIISPGLAQNPFTRVIAWLFGYDRNFMLLLMVVGWACFFVVVYLNISYSFNSATHPINIALLYVIVLFALVNFLVKGTQVVFWKGREESSISNQKLRRRYSRVVGGTAIVLVILYNLSSIRIENHFHELERIAISEVEMGMALPDYFSRRWAAAHKDSNGLASPFFMIAADGGGLRACYWTMNVLYALDDSLDNKLFDRTLAMSGASGGMLGVGMYLTLKRLYPNDRNQLRAAIDRIGNGNFISNDFTFLLGKNVVKNFIPFNISCLDDGSEKMALSYMKLAKNSMYGRTLNAVCSCPKGRSSLYPRVMRNLSKRMVPRVPGCKWAVPFIAYQLHPKRNRNQRHCQPISS